MRDVGVDSPGVRRCKVDSDFLDGRATGTDEVTKLSVASVACGAAAQQCESFAAQLRRTASTLQAMQVGSRLANSQTERLVAVQSLIAKRRRRDHFFAAELFADPAWDMLLDLYRAALEHHRVSVSSLCIAAAVPATTALRWISKLVDQGLIERRKCQSDGRVFYVELTEQGFSRMDAYFRGDRHAGRGESIN